MLAGKLPPVIRRWEFLLIFLVISGFLNLSGALAEVSQVTPNQEVTIENQLVHSKTRWKEYWDKAREHVKRQDFHNAKLLYQQVLEMRPNIVEARWELCKLLIVLQEYKEATPIIEGLTELEPNNLEYLLAKGEITLHNNQIERSIRLYGRVFESDPTGRFSQKALKGLYTCYKKSSNYQALYLVAEQLYKISEDKFLIEDLANIGLQLGHTQRARYYFSLLVEKFPDNIDFLHKAARVYDSPETITVAVEYWNRIIEIDNSKVDIHRRLAEYYSVNDNAAKAVYHLEHLYKVEKLDASLALKIAEQYYNQLNRPDKALLYYEQYAIAKPSYAREVDRLIGEIREVLADQYLPIIENGGSQRLWLDLDRITLTKGVLFKKMAERLGEMQKYELEYEILQYVLQESMDLGLLHRSGVLAYQLSRYREAYLTFVELDDNKYWKKKYLHLKGQYELQNGKEKKAFSSFKRHLEHFPEDEKIIEQSYHLIGAIGNLSDIKGFHSFLVSQKLSQSIHLDATLHYLSVLNRCGFYSESEKKYFSLLDQFKNDPQFWATISFHLADSLIEQKLYFKAEQIIRQVLARDLATNRAIEKLVDLSIKEKQFVNARSWMELLRERMNGSLMIEGGNPLELLEIDLLIAEHEYDEALEYIQDNLLGKDTEVIQYNLKQVVLRYLRAAYLSGDKEACRKKLQEIDKELLLDPSIHTYAMLASGTKDIQDSSQLSFIDNLEKSDVYFEVEEYQQGLALIDQALEKYPESLLVKRVKIEFYEALSDFSQAITMIDSLTEEYPSLAYYNRLKLEFEFKSGNFEKVVEKVSHTERQISKQDLPVDEDKGDIYFWKKLLLARALWAQNKREESIQVYDSLVSTPVDTMFLEKVEVEKINFTLPPLKKSFWNVITFTSPPQPDPITTVMDPKFVASNKGKPVDDIAAGMYGKYRWQKLIKKELSARKATESKDYFTAEKQYLSLLKEEKSEETLFDLAEIYNRLGLYGKAAELYELMKEKGPLYPGLDEYIDANVLKRQPRVAANFLTENKKGRDGYINMKKASFGTEGWFMPSYDQEISLQIMHNTYDSYDESPDYSTFKLLGTYSTYFEDTLDMNIGFGVNKPIDDGTTEILYKIELIGRLSDKVEGYGRFEQDLVEDNLQSVTRSILHRDLETGIKYDLFPRWFLGADYRYRIYSDDNQQNRYKLWSMYHLFGEKNQFKLKYSYENIRNNSENSGRKDLSLRNRFEAGDTIYWSPNHYWQHLFTMHFMHLFEPTTDPKSPLSYVSLDYSIGYEENYNITHQFDANIFLEIDRHYLLKGNLRNNRGDEYKATEASIALVYRW